MTSEDGDTKKGMNNTCVFGANKREINLMVIRAWTLKKRRKHWTQHKEQTQTQQKKLKRRAVFVCIKK
jgi:hypothetical protein